MQPYVRDSDSTGITVCHSGYFSPEKTFDCGQCFRFEPLPEGGVTGIALGRRIKIRRTEDALRIDGITAEEFSEKWCRYLSLDTDYGEIDRIISSALPADNGGAVLASAVEASRGIRILRQEKWEALCSFIISQNNNIPRIRGIIEAMCRTYGTRIGNGDYAFPAAEVIAAAGEHKLLELRTGFRAKYICDAARRVSEDPTFLDRVSEREDYADADEMLRRIKGVGPKVSACTLLFGFGRTEAFPIDVWIKRVIEKYFPDGLDPSVFGNAAGIAQQYLFYYERYTGGTLRTSQLVAPH